MNESDGRWHAEQEPHGRWIAVRYVDHGLGLNDRYERERDGEWRGQVFSPNYYDLLDQCDGRCRELNGEVD